MEDPVKVDPNHYTVAFENDKVRVLRIKPVLPLCKINNLRILRGGEKFDPLLQHHLP